MKQVIKFLKKEIVELEKALHFYRDGKNKRGEVDLTDDFREKMTAQYTQQVKEFRDAVKLLEDYNAKRAKLPTLPFTG